MDPIFSFYLFKYMWGHTVLSQRSAQHIYIIKWCVLREEEQNRKYLIKYLIATPWNTNFVNLAVKLAHNNLKMESILYKLFSSWRPTLLTLCPKIIHINF